MKWFATRSLRTTLIVLVVAPLVLLTAVVAVTAMRAAKQSVAYVEAHASGDYRDEILAIVRGGADGTARNDANYATAMILLALVGAVAASHRLRRRVAAISHAASRLAEGALSEPVPHDGADELGLLARSLDRMRRDLKESARLKAKKAELERDLAITADVQARFLPASSAIAANRLRVAGRYEPASQCGGDWWWHEAQEDGSTLLLVGDVTGHGVGPALVTASMSTTLDCACREGLTTDVPAVMELMSETLRATAGEEYRMTMSAIRLEPDAGKLTWWSAGAPPIMIQRAGGKLETLWCAGAWLGDEDFTAGTVEAEFAAGDRLLVFTDGVNEMVLPSGDEYGFRRVRKLLKSSVDEAPNEAIELISRELESARSGVEPEDDITFVLVEHDARSAA